MESKNPQVLIIDPSHELVFKGPFTDVSTTMLKLNNPTDRIVCYKVKTTAPKQYCVRPNSGVILAGQKAEINVMLQPGVNENIDPSRHKFMVQSCFVSKSDVDLDGIWKAISSEDLMYSKLRVSFVNATNSSNEDIPAAKKSTPPLSTAVAAVQHNDTTVDTVATDYTTTRRKLEFELNKTKKDLQDMITKYTKAEMDRQNYQENAGVSLMHVILFCVVALLLGLVFGKIF